ncbi:MAG TPA: hypothetical protein VF138_05785 [Caulobacteraceae bacterium]
MRLNALTLTLLIALIVLIAVGAYYFGRRSNHAPRLVPVEPAAEAVQTPADADVPAPPEPPAPKLTAASFRGEWNSKLEDCGTGNNDSRLVIGADTIAFHESSGPIKSVGIDGRTATFTSELSGEGETFDFSRTFRLSEDGKALTDLASGLTRQRCAG